MRQTDNYNLNIAEGSDLYNHLTVDNPNYERIDTQMKTNEVNGCPNATELTSGTVHAITRSKPDASIFHFTATSNWKIGDTMTVDSTQVTVLLPNGATLGEGAYIIGSEVLGCLVGTRVTLFITPGDIELAENSLRLGGELPEYYGKADDVRTAISTAQAANTIAQAVQTSVNNYTKIETNEQEIGTYFNKPLYRKGFTITSNTFEDYAQVRNFNFAIDLLGFDSAILGVKGELKYSGFRIPFGISLISGNAGTVTYNSAINSLQNSKRYRVDAQVPKTNSNCTIEIVVEYTKE